MDIGPLLTQVQNLPQIGPGSVVAALLIMIAMWEKIKGFLSDLNVWVNDCVCNFHLTYQVSPAIQDSLANCFKTEPIMGLYGERYQDVLSVEFRLERNGRRIAMEPENGKVVIALPSKSMRAVVKGLDMHVQKNMAPLLGSFYPPKLQRALEVYVMKLIMTHCNLDGALRIAMSRFLSKMNEDKDIGLLFDTVANVNSALKGTKPFKNKNFLRILLLEFCRVEINAVGRVFV
jgi:hypothetical protein